MARMIVTGGSGFIGTTLVEELLKKGHEVLNIDLKKPVDINFLKFWHSVDILDFDRLSQIITAFDPEVIIHLAAVTDLNGKDLSYYKANIEGTLNIILIAEKLNNLKRVIYTSSMYVCEPGFIPTDFDTYMPHTVYGESKVEAEKLVKAIGNRHYSWTIIRPTSIWGPWFDVPYIDFFDVVYKKKYFNFRNTCTKTYGYVENTVYQIISLIDSEDVSGQTFYLGDEPAIPISEWANEISILMGKGRIMKLPFSFIKLAAYVGDMLDKMKLRFPITSFRLKNMTTDNVLPLAGIYRISGTPPINREIAIRKTLKWMREHKGYRFPQEL